MSEESWNCVEQFNRWRAAQAARLKAAEAALQKQAAAASEVNEALLLNLGTNSQASRMLRACRIHSHAFQTSSVAAAVEPRDIGGVGTGIRRFISLRSFHPGG